MNTISDYAVIENFETNIVVRNQLIRIGYRVSYGLRVIVLEDVYHEANKPFDSIGTICLHVARILEIFFEGLDIDRFP